MEFVLIQAGEFMMGSTDSDQDAQADEKPQHKVQITKPFYLGKYEVTQAEWKAVMGTEPWKGKEHTKEGNRYAASYISQLDAVEFAKRLSERDGVTYKLPTEAQWEYACRAGTKTRWHFGNDATLLPDHAWFTRTQPMRVSRLRMKSGLRSRTHGVFSICMAMCMNGVLIIMTSHTTRSLRL